MDHAKAPTFPAKHISRFDEVYLHAGRYPPGVKTLGSVAAPPEGFTCDSGRYPPGVNTWSSGEKIFWIFIFVILCGDFYDAKMPGTTIFISCIPGR